MDIGTEKKTHYIYKKKFKVDKFLMSFRNEKLYKYQYSC